MQLEDFKQQVLTQKNRLFRFALRILGDHSDAEDVVQEVMIKLWNNRENLHQYKNLEAWCMTMTRNKAIDKLRSKHRKNQEIAESMALMSNSPNPDRSAENKNAIQLVKTFIDELPEKQKLVIQLRDIEGYSYKEIAEVLSIPMNQVKVNLFRARNAVKTKFINTESYGI